MKVLGIVDAAQDSAACLAEDGVVLACVQEERLRRVKHCGGFPALAVGEVLRSTGTAPGEVEAVRAGFAGFDLALRLAFGGGGTPPAAVLGKPLAQGLVAGFEAYRWSVLHTPLAALDGWASRRLFERRVRRMGLGHAPVEHVDHHLAHAVAAFRTSGFDRAVALVADAYGDGTSGGVYACGPGGIEELSTFPVRASLGYFYGAVTEVLGLRFGFDEGKTMALASLGRPSRYDALRRLFSVDGLELSGDAARFRRLESLRYARTLSGAEAADIAASAQAVLEDVVARLVENAIDATGTRKVVLGGGLFLNVKANGAVAALDGVGDVFVHPDTGDGGCAVGAAISAFDGAAARTGRMAHAYLGPEADAPAAHAVQERYGDRVQVSEPGDVEGLVGSELLPAGRLVGVCWGRMEHGPRALGNRSVLADPRDPESPRRIRATLKARPAYQPFCPTVLGSAARGLIENPRGIDAPFMTLAFPATERARAELPAVVHVDGSSRPQVLASGVNDRYQRLIEAFGRETGTPAVLNTSFNRSGEPIVCTAWQAIDDLLAGGLDAVVVGDLLVERAGAAVRASRPAARRRPRAATR